MTKVLTQSTNSGTSVLRAVRIARGRTLRSVARDAGIDAGQLSKVERGHQGLSVEALHRLACVLGLDELAALLAPHLMDNK